MNIFILHEDPVKAAQDQCDKHVVKMIVESAQMLSTVHRMLDGSIETRKSKSGKTNVKYWKLDGHRENLLYKAVHMNHPCTVWSRESSSNYRWHYQHFIALCREYTYRYGKIHKTDSKLRKLLYWPPRHISDGEFTQPPQAMPNDVKHEDSITAYRNYYKVHKEHLAKWTERPRPIFMDWAT